MTTPKPARPLRLVVGGKPNIPLIAEALGARAPKPRAAKPKAKPKGRVVWLVGPGPTGLWSESESVAVREAARYGGTIHRIELPARKERG